MAAGGVLHMDGVRGGVHHCFSQNSFGCKVRNPVQTDLSKNGKVKVEEFQAWWDPGQNPDIDPYVSSVLILCWLFTLTGKMSTNNSS